MSSATHTAAGASRTVKGRSIVAGEAVTNPPRPGDLFRAIDPTSGRELSPAFGAAGDLDIDNACWQAWQAFQAMQEVTGAQRAALLDAIAMAIVDLGDDLLGVASDETGLGPARLVSERERTVGTLRLFASLVRKGEWVGATIDTGQAARRPVPKPDVRRMLRPLGPVAVFGAGNFPLAYSAAGGDTASALGAGCPVVVKGHPGHPGTGEMVASAVSEAVRATGFPRGVFSFLHSGGTREFAIGERLVTNPCIRAAGFTGSFRAGTALAKLASSRPDPIPVFAEMGSTNPVFLLPGALETQGEQIASRMVGSITNANGQMCTCPGLIFVARDAAAEQVVRAMAEALNQSGTHTMLNHRVRAGYAQRVSEVAEVKGVEIRGGSVQAGHRTAAAAQTVEAGQPIRCSAVLFRTTFEVFARTAALHEEVFGPAAIVVVCDTARQLVEAAASIQGSLTGTIWASTADAALARSLAGVLEQRVGRIVYNGVPTGVEVCAAMVHGGPWPATNQAHTTAVGPYAIQRWCRPVCYQNAPETMLPPELRSANPLGITRLVNGEPSAEPLSGRS